VKKMNQEKAIIALAVMGVALLLIGSPIMGNISGLVGGFVGRGARHLGASRATGFIAGEGAGLATAGLITAAILAPATGGASLGVWAAGGL
jgi:hypothetical protein